MIRQAFFGVSIVCKTMVMLQTTVTTAAAETLVESSMLSAALCSPLTVVQAQVALTLFHSVGLRLLATNASNVTAHCVDAVRPTFFSCNNKAGDKNNHATTTVVAAAATVHNVSMQLMRVAGISRRLPLRAWTSSFVACLHHHHHHHHHPQVRLYRDHNNSSEAAMMMRQAWLGIVSAPKQQRHQQQQHQSCAEGDQCALHGHWSFAHLNEVDENGVPTLVCNSKTCAAVDRPAASTTEPTTTMTMEHALRMSGWVADQQQNGVDGVDGAESGSKASVDWKRYFYKHLHLDWFHVQPVSASSVARAQLESSERMSSEESTLRGWRIFLVVVASVFFVYVLYRLLREWQCSRTNDDDHDDGDGGGGGIINNAAEVADHLTALVALALFAPFTSHELIVADALASLVVAIAFLALQVAVSTWAWCHYFKKKDGVLHCQRVKNALFLKERLAVCRGRFAVLALGLTVYLLASDHQCLGYRGGRSDMRRARGPPSIRC